MRRVEWAAAAAEDLRNTRNWLLRETSPAFAARTLGAIRFRSKFLVDFPRGGRPYKDGTRILRVLETPYLIHYQLSGETVEVIRLYHEREDWQVEP